jgi:hypothetical protein
MRRGVWGTQWRRPARTGVLSNVSDLLYTGATGAEPAYRTGVFNDFNDFQETGADRRRNDLLISDPLN